MRQFILLSFLASLGLSSFAVASPVQPITFTGSTILSTPVVTDTTLGGTVTAPGLVFPEIIAPTATDLSDGFSITGRFDFLNGTGTSAELTFTATRSVSVSSDSLFTSALIDGQFGIDSTDTGAISTTDADPAVTGNLDSFSATTSLQTTDPSPAILAGSSVIAADSNQTIPLTLSSFPGNSYHSLVGPNFTGPFTGVGDFLLVQTVDIKISGLLPGEAVDINLPTTSTLDTVPEPAAAALLLNVFALVAGRKSRG